MPKSSADYEKEFVDALKASSGKDLKTWMRIAKTSGKEKHNEVLNLFKKEHGFNHMQANFLASIYRNGGNLVYGDSESMLEIHFKGKESMKEPYNALRKMITDTFPRAEVIPTKGYISFRNPREFAVAKITRNAIRLGMDLGDAPFEWSLVKSKSLGAMPRISHMIEILDINEPAPNLISFLRSANNRVNER